MQILNSMAVLISLAGVMLPQQRTPADTALEVLESAFRTTTPTFAEAPLPQDPFLTEEICEPCSIPWPEGRPVRAVRDGALAMAWTAIEMAESASVRDRLIQNAAR